MFCTFGSDQTIFCCGEHNMISLKNNMMLVQHCHKQEVRCRYGTYQAALDGNMQLKVKDDIGVLDMNTIFGCFYFVSLQDGNTAMDIAKAEEHDDIFDILQQYGLSH